MWSVCAAGGFIVCVRVCVLVLCCCELRQLNVE